MNKQQQQQQAKQQQPTRNQPQQTKTRKRRSRRKSNQSQSVAVQAPVAMGRIRRSGTARFQNVGRSGDIMVTHREFVAELLGSVGFTATKYAINPGLIGSFPWLSNIAQRFESYKFESLAYIFETEAATSFTGSVFNAVDFDASDGQPDNRTQMATYRGFVRTPPWADSRTPLAREDLAKRQTYFVRNGSLASNQDIKLYDTGNWWIATQGQASTAAVGELYVEYTVRFYTPQMDSPGVGSALYGAYGGTSNVAPFADSNGNLPAVVASSGTTTSVTTWTFTQPWKGYGTLVLEGTGITGAVPSGTGTEVEATELVNAGATKSIGVYAVSVDAGQTFVLTAANTTITSSVIYFGQASP